MFKFIALAVVLGVCRASYHSDSNHHSVELPIHSKSTQEVVHTESHREEQITKVEVPSDVMPVYLTFKTQSSPVHVRQVHKGTKGSHQKSDSKDEPHILVHEVIKPVIQEYKEIIEPHRKVVQIIKPVHESVLTKVHEREGKSGNGNHGDRDGYDGQTIGYKSGYDGQDDDDHDNDKYEKYNKKSKGGNGGNGGGSDGYKHKSRNDKYKKDDHDDNNEKIYKKYLTKTRRDSKDSDYKESLINNESNEKYSWFVKRVGALSDRTPPNDWYIRSAESLESGGRKERTNENDWYAKNVGNGGYGGYGNRPVGYDGTGKGLAANQGSDWYGKSNQGLGGGWYENTQTLPNLNGHGGNDWSLKSQEVLSGKGGNDWYGKLGGGIGGGVQNVYGGFGCHVGGHGDRSLPLGPYASVVRRSGGKTGENHLRTGDDVIKHQNSYQLSLNK